MRKEIAVFVIGVLSTTFCSATSAQQLPKTGSINFHTGWKFLGEVVNVADKHVQGHGSATGSTFNDKGSGPLHLVQGRPQWRSAVCATARLSFAVTEVGNDLGSRGRTGQKSKAHL